jgi:hypothetical protein
MFTNGRAIVAVRISLGENRAFHELTCFAPRFVHLSCLSPQSHVRELGGLGRLGCCSFNDLKSTVAVKGEEGLAPGVAPRK